RGGTRATGADHVADTGSGVEEHGEALVVYPAAVIHVFDAEEVARVEETGVLHRPAADEHAATGDPVHLPQVAMVPVAEQVAARPRVAREEAREQRVAAEERRAGAGKRSRRKLHRAARVLDAD